MELETIQTDAQTEVGSYFIANYPPFSVWRPEFVPDAFSAMNADSGPDAPPAGLYLHIPFCRTRCKFCYFRVYTDRNSSDVDVYLNALIREIELYSRRRGLAGRDFEFVYFGGGTPSFLSSDQLHRLVDGISRYWRWDRAREVTFECEPGTLKKQKLETIKAIVTTRLSLGIEHFDDEILAENGRAHRSAEVFRAYDWAREAGFRQINIDLIAGMLGDTDAKWDDAVEKALALSPDSITIYQMELPYNTLIAREARLRGATAPIPGWLTKRTWVNRAFRRFESAGYAVSSAYTLVKPSPDSGFVYRDSLWHGADMIGTGVASFSHFGGVHYQNVDGWDEYVGRLLEEDTLPVHRAFPLNDERRMTRELVLQLKLGRLDANYFLAKFEVDIMDRFDHQWSMLAASGLLSSDDKGVSLTREGLLRVDAILPEFFESEFRNIRYT
jgi:oxygen-independent coproporphyrinogen-3 oxidase